METRPLPRERLDPRARTLWRLSGVIQSVVFLVPAVLVTIGLIRFDFAPVWIAVIPTILALLIGVVSIWLYPAVLYRHWRYEIGETEVDLQFGWLTVTRTLIPMTRIQHVDTRRGPLQRRFGLASVILYTAAGASEIPALADAIADGARDRIASLANVADDL